MVPSLEDWCPMSTSARRAGMWGPGVAIGREQIPLPRTERVCLSQPTKKDKTRRSTSWDGYSRRTNYYCRRIDHHHDCPTEEGSMCHAVSRTRHPLQDITVLKACCFCAMNILLYKCGVILYTGFTCTSLKSPSESYLHHPHLAQEALSRH